MISLTKARELDETADYLLEVLHLEEEKTDVQSRTSVHEVMLTEVNRIRDEHRMPHASLTDITKIDEAHLWRADYAEKFTWYCAELALGISE